MRKPTLAAQREALAARWSRFDPDETRRILSRRPLVSPFGTTPEGLADMQGLVLSASIRNGEVHRADFSFMTDKASVLYASFFDCVFNRVEMETSFGEHFERCTFTHARVHGSQFSGKFVECAFERGDLGSLLASHVPFERCTFRNLTLRSLRVYGCIFDRCQFVDCKFIGGSLGDCQFRDCKFERVVFDDPVMAGVQGIDGIPADELARIYLEVSN
jgi:uncharacterized protein YjbI with pentapeptide repeats